MRSTLSPLAANVRKILAGARAAAPDDAPATTTRWAASPALSLALERMVALARPRSILELGAGASSLVLARALVRLGGGRLTSLEHLPRFALEAWREVERVPGVDARLVASRLRLRASAAGVHYTYADAEPELARRGPFDLVFVDGPPIYYGRDGAMHLAHPHLSPGALVVLDDAARPGEQRTLRRWRRVYPDLTLLVMDSTFGRHGCAVLVCPRKPRPPVFSLAAFLDSVVESGRALRHVLRRRRARRLAAAP